MAWQPGKRYFAKKHQELPVVLYNAHSKESMPEHIKVSKCHSQLAIHETVTQTLWMVNIFLQGSPEMFQTESSWED
jgi:hypothetical protein